MSHEISPVDDLPALPTLADLNSDLATESIASLQSPVMVSAPNGRVHVAGNKLLLGPPYMFRNEIASHLRIFEFNEWGEFVQHFDLPLVEYQPDIFPRCDSRRDFSISAIGSQLTVIERVYTGKEHLYFSEVATIYTDTGEPRLIIIQKSLKEFPVLANPPVALHSRKFFQVARVVGQNIVEIGWSATPPWKLTIRAWNAQTIREQATTDYLETYEEDILNLPPCESWEVSLVPEWLSDESELTDNFAGDLDSMHISESNSSIWFLHYTYSYVWRIGVSEENLGSMDVYKLLPIHELVNTDLFHSALQNNRSAPTEHPQAHSYPEYVSYDFNLYASEDWLVIPIWSDVGSFAAVFSIHGSRLSLYHVFAGREIGYSSSNPYRGTPGLMHDVLFVMSTGCDVHRVNLIDRSVLQVELQVPAHLLQQEGWYSPESHDEPPFPR